MSAVIPDKDRDKEGHRRRTDEDVAAVDPPYFAKEPPPCPVLIGPSGPEQGGEHADDGLLRGNHPGSNRPGQDRKVMRSEHSDPVREPNERKWLRGPNVVSSRRR